jgi:hypothetical protein
LILSSLCYDIMDEVMDLDSAYPMDCNTILRKNHLPPHMIQRVQIKGKINIEHNERDLLEYKWVKRPQKTQVY